MNDQYFKELQAQKLGFKPKAEKKLPKPIARVSEKRKQENKVYKKIVKEVLRDDKTCKIGAPGCKKVANGLHHIQKRSPGNLTKKENLVPCCNHCNLWIEENSKVAKDLGFTISRFKKDKRA